MGCLVKTAESLNASPPPEEAGKDVKNIHRAGETQYLLSFGALHWPKFFRVQYQRFTEPFSRTGGHLELM